ncbi:hypothetical protein KIH31_16040 [Paenarthrobacter sp. DKR-5]|nr:hypothetical protein [Paenarthrobacter sp. DKR-5]
MAEIAAVIEHAFRELPLRPGRLSAQPSPHTLRGAQTNFFIDAVTQDFDIQLLGQKVHVHAVPVEYKWNYGDGSSLGPVASSGGSLPQNRWGEKTNTSHAYGATGDFSVTATTYFQGTYSVNGGPELPIPGTGEFSTPPVSISVWRSVTRNYADNCLQNPHGAGC